MIKKKQTKKYYFTVEGETEHWYLKWLQNRINECETAKYKVTFDCPVQKNPVKRAKALSVTGKTEIWHLSDYESSEQVHEEQFIKTMDNMKAAKELGKQINYKFGYSNLTFDLWIILHKTNCYASYAHRKNYIDAMNRAYGEHFENLDEYKHEDNFKRCLKQLSLDNVKEAVRRAEYIMDRNAENGYVLQRYKGYQYYKENPSLAIHEIIGMILQECGIL